MFTLFPYTTLFRSLRERCGATRARQGEGLFGGVWMAHDVNVDARSRPADHLSDHRAAREALPARAPARAHHDLRRVQRARGIEERIADVLAYDLVVARADLGDELLLALEKLGGRRREAVLRDHVHRDELAVHPRCHARGPPNQALPVGGAGQRHEHPLARLPGLVDPVSVAVLLEPFVHAVCEPREGELAERREVSWPEVVGEGGVDALGRVHVAAREPVARRSGRGVPELDLGGAADDLVGDRLLLLDAGDLLDDVVQRFEVLDVERGDDRDARVEQLLDVLPALVVPRAGRVRVRELVDEGDVGPAGEHGVDVHLPDGCSAVLDVFARDDLEVADLFRRLRPAVWLDVADDDVLAVAGAAPPLVEHGVRLADARCGAEVDAELAPGHRSKATPGLGRD